MQVPKFIQLIFILVFVTTIVLLGRNYLSVSDTQLDDTSENIPESHLLQVSSASITSDREILNKESITLPIAGIVPDTQVTHSIPVGEIRQGCSRQDCISSVDSPRFISNAEAIQKIDATQIGIALSYKGEDRFYPFSMLVTKEIVNDMVANDPLLVTYCPLCGTGIVFDRTVDGVVYEFGVSGMLWQSNLLMYNRADGIKNRNLWSQVLGEAVVGERTGTQLSVIPSDIVQFKTWSETTHDGLVLDTGSQRDPYSGKYYEIAQRFAPSYSPESSPFIPEEYVYGIQVAGQFKAYPRDLLPEGTFRDMINDEEITITNSGGKVSFISEEGMLIQDVEGFWFSWVAVHPQTLVWNN